MTVSTRSSQRKSTPADQHPSSAPSAPPSPAPPTKPNLPPTPTPSPIPVPTTRVDSAITSPLARAALTFTPLLTWLLTVALGILTHPNPPLLTRPRTHPLAWFDHLVFRRYGAALPFLFLLPRISIGHTTGRAATWGRPCALLYATFTLLRLSFYALHLLASTGGQPQVLSDHIYLAASVVACLHLELVCTVNDAVKAVREAPEDTLGALAGSAGIVLQVVTLLLVSGDMFFTAKYYHHRLESAVALVLGMVTFQGPILWLLWRRPARKPAAA